MCSDSRQLLMKDDEVADTTYMLHQFDQACRFTGWGHGTSAAVDRAHAVHKLLTELYTQAQLQAAL